ncbi:MAG: hypothetical protein KGK11_10100 [Sphingomonadales bacterium]|nr:hypothetical protein [Sphingomonadales bacterium]
MAFVNKIMRSSPLTFPFAALLRPMVSPRLVARCLQAGQRGRFRIDGFGRKFDNAIVLAGGREYMAHRSMMAGFLAGIALLGSGSAVRAQAVTKAWVSVAKGVDSGSCGAASAPCRTFQYAHDHVIAGGEIDVLDPGGYGVLTITKAVSIVNDGSGTAGITPTSGSAITVHANPGDIVLLHGLTLDGLGQGGIGVNYVTGGGLVIQNCTARNFTTAGIAIFAIATNHVNVEIRDSHLDDNVNPQNQASGLLYYPLATAQNSQLPAATPSVSMVIDNVTANRNNTGFTFAAANASGGGLHATIRRSSASQNSLYGFALANPGGADMGVIFDSAEAAHNGNIGIGVGNTNGTGSTTVAISAVLVTNNGQFGINNQIVSGTGNFFTAGNNLIGGNGGNAANNVNGAALTTYAFQ